MRKFFLVAVAAAIAVGGFTVVSHAGKGEDGTVWEGAYKPAKVNKSVSFDASIKPAREMEGGGLAETKKTTIVFTPTTEFDTSVPPRCTATGGEVVASNGQVCKKAEVGDGDAVALVGAADFNAELTAYNRKKGILFLVVTCNLGTGPGTDTECTPLEGGTFALEGKIKYQDDAKTKPILVVPTPQTLLDGNIIIKEFNLVTDKITEGGDAYIESPEKCKKGKFKTSAKIEYDGGVAGQTIKDSQAC